MSKTFSLPDLGEGLTEAEIAASIMEGAFLSLEAPIRRVTAHDVPFVGFARERANLPDVARVLDACRETLSF